LQNIGFQAVIRLILGVFLGFLRVFRLFLGVKPIGGGGVGGVGGARLLLDYLPFFYEKRGVETPLV